MAGECIWRQGCSRPSAEKMSTGVGHPESPFSFKRAGSGLASSGASSGLGSCSMPLAGLWPACLQHPSRAPVGGRQPAIGEPPNALWVLRITGVPVLHVFRNRFGGEGILGQGFVTATIREVLTLESSHPFGGVAEQVDQAERVGLFFPQRMGDPVGIFIEPRMFQKIVLRNLRATGQQFPF